jgi:hypothetical protein
MWRTVKNNDGRVIEAYFPDRPQNVQQDVAYQQNDFWGPNIDGWVFTVHNGTGNEINWTTGYPPFTANTSDKILKLGAKGAVKCVKSLFGGPANCTYRVKEWQKPKIPRSNSS